ncbi:MAG TPA: glycosyltransferase family 39 protein [Nitrososphaera sp.]|nr:glycosyltransferase family 39 protein [Nitrososphaera sp.]
MKTEQRLEITHIDHRTHIVVIFGVIMVLGFALSLSMYIIDKSALTYYGDSVSHLAAARKLFDWAENPGWNQIGTVWLPLPHVLLMFPSLDDALFFSGFAGLAISLPSLAATSILIYKMATRLLISTAIPNVGKRTIPYAAFAAALLYGTNPNFLYLGITAMTEAPFMLFFVASAYFLLRWHEEKQRQQQQGQNANPALKYLLVSSLFAAAATLCRYEGWMLPFFLILYTSIRQFAELLARRRVAKNVKNEEEERRAKVVNAYEEKQINIRMVVYAILLSGLSLSGIVFWLVYNAMSYGDPLEFAHAQYYSAASQALSRPIRENLYLQPYNVANVYGLTAFMVYGPVILAAAPIGYYYLHRWSTLTTTKPRKDESNGRPKKISMRYLFIFLSLPPLFTVITMLIGIGEMTFWFNSRFTILLAPLLMILVGFYIAKQPKKIAANRVLLGGVVAALFAFQLAMPAFSAVVTLDDAKGGFTYKYPPYAIATGEKLGSLYDGTGTIMVITGSAQEHRILLASGIAFRNFDSIIESSTWKDSFHEPWKYNDKWIVIAKDPDSDAASVVKYWMDNRSTLLQHYRSIFDNEYYEILTLK